jgi:hypothetical protein
MPFAYVSAMENTEAIFAALAPEHKNPGWEGVRMVAEALDLPVTTVDSWRRRGKIPKERVLDVERVTGKPCWVIRPDLYPPERFAPAEAGAVE